MFARLLILLAGLAVAFAGTSIDCEGTEIHELVVKYDSDTSDGINSTELLTMSLALGLPLTSDEATGVVTKYGGNTGELTDAQLCNYLNTMLDEDTTTTTDSSKSSSLRGSSKKSSKKSTSVKGINFEETFNPTPEGPEGGFGTKKTNKPSSEKASSKRTLKKILPEDGGKGESQHCAVCPFLLPLRS